MPDFAIYNKKIIKPSDIYKYDIPTTINFECFFVMNILHLKNLEMVI